MPVFTYRARTPTGSVVRGRIEAVAETQALRELESRGVYPVEVRETAPDVGLAARIRHRLARRRIKRDARILFIRQFEAMLRAGVPLTVALESIADQADSPELAQMLRAVRADIEGGSTLAQALRGQSALLSPIHVSLIDAGEQGGILDDIVSRIGELLEWEAENVARIRQATFYPALVIGELSLAFVVIVRFVFPRFKALFAAHNAQLPMPTQVMIGISDFVEAYGAWMLVGLVLAAAGAVWAYRRPEGRRVFDRLFIRVPIFGPLVLLILMSRFARVTASLLRAGIPFLRALSIVERTIDNVVIQRDIARMTTGIQQGLSVAESVPDDGVIPPAVRRMLDIGERSGRVSDMLERISAFYDTQADYRIKNLTTVLEPILLVVLGASVLFVALAVFLPMWDMTRVITGG